MDLSARQEVMVAIKIEFFPLLKVVKFICGINSLVQYARRRKSKGPECIFTGFISTI